MSNESEIDGVAAEQARACTAFTGYISGGLPTGVVDYGFRTIWFSPDEAPDPVLVIPLFGEGFERAVLAGAEALKRHGTAYGPEIVSEVVVRAIVRAAA